MREIVYSYDDLALVVQELVGIMEYCHIITLTGSLGAGKTTLVRALLHAQGVVGPITSPTFTYVNVYYNSKKQRFNHFDLYRLDYADEFIAAGFDELLCLPYTWSFIEWPSVVEPLLHGPVCHVSLDYISESARKMTYYLSGIDGAK